jgi:integrase
MPRSSRRKAEPRRARRNSFGTIIATGTSTHPRFSIRWWEGNRRRKQGGFKSRTDALEGLARVRAGLSDGTLITKRGASIGFDKAAEEWLDLHSKPNLRSHDDNEERYKRHVKPFFGTAPLAAITPARVLQLRAHLQGKTRPIRIPSAPVKGRRPAPPPKFEHRPLSARTVNLVMALVRSILRFAMANGHILASPTDRIGRGKLMLAVKKTKIDPPIRSAEEVGRFLEAVRILGEETHRPGLHGLVATLTYTGLRRGEACGLRWSNVDLERRLITVRRSYAGPTKSGKDRMVPISAELVPILKQHKLADPWKSDLVFPWDDGEMISPDARLRDIVNEACTRCNIPRIRTHDLRHVFASYFVMGGGDIFTLQRILGHSTPQITSDTYAHLSPGHLAGTADRVSFPVPQTGKVLSMKDESRGR